MTINSDKPYPYYLVRTAFHGGGVVSRHWTEANAERARKRWVGPTDCTCGCAVVVAAEDYATLPRVDQNPSAYAAARR